MFVQESRATLACLYKKSDGEMVSKVVLWTPKHGQRKQERPVLTYIASLTKDTGLPADELGSCMKDRTVWVVHHCSCGQKTAHHVMVMMT